MRLASIEIKDFRAFKGIPLKIDLTSKGKNLLVYGENGSGKSSLYLAVRDFLESAAKSSDITKFPFQNIFVSTNDGFVKLDFVDDASDPEAKLYEWSSTKSDTAEPLILEIDKTKGFIDYKALLRTHLLQNESDSVNIFNLLVTSVLSNITNDITSRTFGEEWRKIESSIPYRNYKKYLVPLERQIKGFNDGLRVKLDELRDRVEEMLRYFGYEDVIALEFGFAGVSYNRAKRYEDKGFDNRNVGLRVKFFTQDLAEHQHVFNEAKLSAIAMSIFFAALLLQPAPPHGLRLLALDDMLIGLDMSHRLPVLDILDNHFKDYQLFLFTYDRAWYEIVKLRVGEKRWKHVELFAHSTNENDVLVYADDRNYLERAKEYLLAHDHKASAIYQRTHFELIMKRFCEKMSVKVKYTSDQARLMANDLWNAIKSERHPKHWTGLTDRLVADVESYRKFILNELSHASWSTIYPAEVGQSITVIGQLDAELNAIMKAKAGSAPPTASAPSPAPPPSLPPVPATP